MTALTTGRITAELVWNLASPRRRADPFPAYAKLQRLERIHRSPIGVTLLSGYDEVAEALRDPRLSTDEVHLDPKTLRIGPLRRLIGSRGETLEQGPYFERVGQSLLFRDPPDHTRLRRLVSRAFTPRRVSDLEPRIAAIAAELLADIVPRGRADLVAEFAYPFPARVIGELLGVPDDDLELVIQHAPALAAGIDPLLTPAAATAANAGMVVLVEILQRLIAARRAEPRRDLLSDLLAKVDGEALTDDEVIETVLLLLVAGHETTANLLGNATLALYRQPWALADLRRDRSLDAAAVDELLRYDSPVQLTMRFATEPVVIGGRGIPEGSVVVMVIGAANRDPNRFAEPDRLDWHRPPGDGHVALGGGIHYCLGATLARTEARIGLRALLDALPSFDLAAEPTWRPSMTIRGLQELHLTW